MSSDNGGAPQDLDDHTATQQSAWKSGSFSAKELQSMKFPPIAWIVRNIVPAEGVVLLCSRPKFGKSWLAYDLCIACTTDRFTLGTIKPAQGNVLYLALEDSKQRLQRRMRKLLTCVRLTVARETPSSDRMAPPARRRARRYPRMAC